MAESPAVPDAVGELICSSKGCRAPAAWGLLWNNPKIHTPQRRKVWLACDDHRAHLDEYLSIRGMLRQVVPAGDLPRTDAG